MFITLIHEKFTKQKLFSFFFEKLPFPKTHRRQADRNQKVHNLKVGFFYVSKFLFNDISISNKSVPSTLTADKL